MRLLLGDLVRDLRVPPALGRSPVSNIVGGLSGARSGVRDAYVVFVGN